MGRLLGWKLQSDGHDVTLYERSAEHEPTSAAYVAAAMLGPISERPECSAVVWDLALASMRVWPRWLKDLDISHGFDGSVVVAHGTDISLLRKLTRVWETQKVAGVHQLDRVGLLRLEPELPSHFQSGVYLEAEGWLDNRALLNTLAQRCGSIHFGRAVDPCRLDGDMVVDCRGVGDDDPEIRSVRGEIIRVRAPEVALTRPIRLMHPKYNLYVSPRPSHEYVIGATQIESESSAPVTVRSVLELLSAAFTVHSGFAEAEILEMSAGLRPAFPDNSPRVRWRGPILQVNGLYRHGYLIAPAVVNWAMKEMEAAWKLPLTAKA